ncbi:hypothetical protein MNBD_BACTEROID02-389 [hydrothermal vent metagenome]|uniref:Threonine synthase n=1 Tax=hydrothermal vent metagenome TaxID=652676 RepID=A0A3B0RKE9_9ZZZZ
MKNTALLLLTVALMFSCKQEKKANDYKNETLDVTTSIYPENISKILKAHNSLDTWNNMQTLTFTMPKPNGDEVTTTNLKTRKSLIDMPNHAIGFDGNTVWLLKKDTTTYKGNPKFYYNLMFYFYAMPFVLADDGITYKDAEPLTFEDKTYPGIHISYDNGIGASPEDEYVLYYDSDTNKMAWLAYTVTFFTKVKTKEFHLIKYDAWQEVNGLLLPKTFKWYGFENNVVGDYQREMSFVNVSTSIIPTDDSLFEKPNDANIIE